MSPALAAYLVMVPFGDEHLALTLEQIEAARRRAREILPPSPADVTSTSPEPMEPMLTAEALAKLLDVPESQIATMARQGKIPSIRVGKYRRFDRADVVKALASERTSVAVVAPIRLRRRMA